MFQILDHVKCFHILSSLTTTGHWCPKWVLLGAGPPAVVPRDIDAPKIQSECGKIRTRKNFVFGHFSRSVNFF